MKMPFHGPVKDFAVSGKIVAITGGGSGIGFALAQLCHKNGARVLIGDLKLTKEAEDFVSLNSSSNQIAFQKCDVTSWKDLHDLISTSTTKFGDVPDIYCPCAGIFEPPWSNFWDDAEEDFYKTIRINTEHPIKLTRLAMRALIGADKQGVVCLIASTAGIRANYLASLYTASKHAIVGFAKAMGQADGDEGVRVVCVLPGPVDSPLWFDRQDNMLEWSKYKARSPLQPKDVAEVMLKMVQNGNDYEGGCCVLKTIQEERVVEKGHTALVEGYKEYDPSPRAPYDLGRVETALGKERGKGWT